MLFSVPKYWTQNICESELRYSKREIGSRTPYALSLFSLPLSRLAGSKMWVYNGQPNSDISCDNYTSRRQTDYFKQVKFNIQELRTTWCPTSCYMLDQTLLPRTLVAAAGVVTKPGILLIHHPFSLTLHRKHRCGLTPSFTPKPWIQDRTGHKCDIINNYNIPPVR